MGGKSLLDESGRPINRGGKSVSIMSMHPWPPPWEEFYRDHVNKETEWLVSHAPAVLVSRKFFVQHREVGPNLWNEEVGTLVSVLHEVAYDEPVKDRDEMKAAVVQEARDPLLETRFCKPKEETWHDREPLL